MSPIEVKTFWTLIQPTKAKIDTLEDYSFKMSWAMANSVFFFSKFNRQPFDRTFFAFEILLSRDPCDGLSFYKCSVRWRDFNIPPVNISGLFCVPIAVSTWRDENIYGGHIDS